MSPSIDELREALRKLTADAFARPGERVETFARIPADPKRDADILLADALSELDALRRGKEQSALVRRALGAGRTAINPESVKNPFPLPWKADLLDEQDDYIAIEAANGREVARIMRGPLGFTGVELGVARLIAEAFSGKKQPKHYKTFTQHNKEWIQAADVESLRAYAEASNEFSDQWSKERASLEAKLEALEKDFEHAEAEVARLKALDEERCREIQRLRDNETKALVDWTKLRDESESWRHNALAMEGALNALSEKKNGEIEVLKSALGDLLAKVVFRQRESMGRGAVFTELELDRYRAALADKEAR